MKGIYGRNCTHQGIRGRCSECLSREKSGYRLFTKAPPVIESHTSPVHLSGHARMVEYAVLTCEERVVRSATQHFALSKRLLAVRTSYDCHLYPPLRALAMETLAWNTVVLSPSTGAEEIWQVLDAMCLCVPLKTRAFHWLLHFTYVTSPFSLPTPVALARQPNEGRGKYGAALNAKGGETGDPRENPPTSGNVLYDSHVRNTGSNHARNRTRFAEVGGDQANHYTAAGSEGAMVAERLARSPPIKANRVQSPAGFLGDLPFLPPIHSCAAPYSLQSGSSALKTSLLRAAQISSLIHSLIIGQARLQT
ncbi:hypothetical protein PR048_018845 [Dryococelus australis]|uniref:Uncharacterized protein n=1 Tax=Dryococelus australis TaxID=614101 RepID=A0ABQ9H1W2_9NEOP|nr:hypothetical protein PR048_018845 [Dryococelus australis]